MMFGLVYTFSEHFILPISYDEMAHGKGSLLDRVPGDEWQRLVDPRAYLMLVWTHPGEKSLFVSCKFGQVGEWDHDVSPEWHPPDDPRHYGMQRLVHDLDVLYRNEPSLHAQDTAPEGFNQVTGDDRTNNVLAFLRPDGDRWPMLAIADMTPVPRGGYRIGVPPVEGITY